MASTNNVHSSVSTPTPAQQNNARSSSDGITRTKILLLGTRRSGKTSLQQVLFNKLPPKQTFYLDTTMRTVKHVYDTVIPLEIWDCPGNITVETLGAPLSQFTTIVFVIDIRDLYTQPITRLVEFIVAAYHDNPEINLEVFVHKAEKLQEDDKYENFRQINERVSDRLFDLSVEYENIPLNFHLTSVYDHSAHEAFSKVLHKLIASLPYLEHLLNVFCANSHCTKAFLFDINSRLYVATDESPVDNATHDLSCDFLKMLNSFGPLYSSTSASSARHRKPTSTRTPPPTAYSSTTVSRSNSQSVSTDETPSPPSPHLAPIRLPSAPRRKPPRELFYPSAATSLQSPLPGRTLTYHLITEKLALVALLPTAVYEARRGLLEYNVVFLREGVQEIADAELEARGGHVEST